VPKPWAGGHLDNLTGADKGTAIGEYVICSDLEKFAVGIEVEDKVLSLKSFWPNLHTRFDSLPFMLKILSTSDSMSLQNHPSDADVKSLGLTGEGKFECWTILAADNTARAYLGLKPGEKVAVLNGLADETHPLRYFNDFALQSGDVIKLEPGLIHSTTGKLLFYEIQQKSDHTFRIFDFGRPRELHLKEAIFCIRDQKPDVKRFDQSLITEKFSVAYHTAPMKIKRKGSDFSVITWLGSGARLISENKTFALTWGDSLLVTSSAPIEIEGTDDIVSEGLPAMNMLFEAYV